MGFLETWSEQLGKPLAELQEEYNELFAVNVNRHATEEAARTFTLTQLRTRYHNALRTNAIWFHALPIGQTEPNYYLVNKYNKAIAMAENSLQDAIDEGFVDAEGRPVDDRQFTGGTNPNPNYKKPLEDIVFGKRKDKSIITFRDKAISTVIGVAKKKNQDIVKRFVLNLFDDDAKVDFMELNQFEMRANLQKETDEEFTLGMSVTTDPVPLEIPEDDLQMTKVFTNAYFPYVDLTELDTWEDEHPNDFDAIMMTRGMVANMKLDGEKSNTLWLDTVNPELEVGPDGEVPPAVRVTVPKSIPIDFGPESMAIVFGRTWRGYPDDQGKTEVIITAFGLYVPPEFKVDIEEELAEEANEAAEEELENEPIL